MLRFGTGRLRLSRGAGGAPFTPLYLFAGSEQGAWYDPSDLTTLFQDSAGTAPVTAVEQPVGLMLDKRLGLTLGSELFSGGDGSSTSGWTGPTGNGTFVVTGGEFVLTSANPIAAFTDRVAYKQFTGLTVGVTYVATATLRNINATSLGCVADIAASGTGGAVVSTNTTSTSATPVRLQFTATATSLFFRLAVSAGAGAQVACDNISVRELPGNHAYQTTSASRPVLSARVNLLSATTLLDTNWTGASVTRTTVSVTTPINTAAASKIAVNNSTVGEKVWYFNAPPTAVAVSHKALVYAKADTMNWIYLRCDNGTAAGVYFDVANGVVGNADAGAVGAITALPNGWYECTVTRTLSAGSAYGAVQLASANGTKSFAGTVGEGVLVCGADLRVTNDGVGIPSYQRVNTSTDYDTTGFPLYIKPNGSTQWMQTNSIAFTGDKVTVWTGMRKLSDAAVQMVYESSVVSDTNNGTFFLAAPSTSGTASYRGRYRGTVSSEATAGTGYAAPLSNVLTLIGDISGDVATLRINGTQAATSTTDQGTGNFGNYPLYLFARGGTTLHYGGRFYGLIVRGAASDATQIAQTETWMNGKTKAY